MTTTKQNPKVRVRTGVKAGDIKWNHGTRVRIRMGVKAGGPGIVVQHDVRVRPPSP